jgi:hypothetical protein
MKQEEVEKEKHKKAEKGRGREDAKQKGNG